MPRFLLLLTLLPLLACGEPDKADGDKARVKAVVYQVWVVEGAMDMIHGGGHWIREIHLPDANICFNVEDDRLNCFVPDEPRYAAPTTAIGAAHAARRLGEIEVEAEFVASLQQLLKARDEARDKARTCFSSAPPLEK